ncbi:hypothetical protein BN1723_016469 [Verticillium longisporum]|uniref:Uncharacterized protein n=2 Tax=Verticillium longisporum TaxID=100787 RepID=A0A0G4NFC8_VERLO|nr:hypothetical protein HYQ44_003525 [Verticillium longisporum]CRK45099.1 hypothetical protein BN1723_016469 [Verticillium longisporum]
MTRTRKEVDSMSDSLESLETKSSMSGDANSLINRPKPFSIILLLTLFFLLMASIGGLSTSAVDFRTQGPPRRSCITQSFVMFSSLLSPIYVFLHLFVSFRNYEVSRRQPLQSPFVSWTIIVVRLSLLLWVVSVILTAVTVARLDSNSVITRSNLAISIFGVISVTVLILTIEIATHPFELPFTPRATTVSCLVSSFEDDLKRSAGLHYRTMTMDSASSMASSRSSGSRKQYMMPPPGCNRCTTIVEEEEAHMDQEPLLQRNDSPPVLPEPCHTPPGTAWASDWEKLAVDVGVSRNNSVSDYSMSAASDDMEVPASLAIRRPPPAIIVTQG